MNNEFFEDGTPVNEKKSLWAQFKEWVNSNKELAAAISTIGFVVAFNMFIKSKKSKADLNALKQELIYQAGVREGYETFMEKTIDKLQEK